MIRFGFVLVLALVSACKDPAKERAARAAAAKDFWPDAPVPTKKTGTRTFTYNPDQIAAYTLTAKGGTPRGSKVGLAFTLALDLEFGAGDAPRERTAFVKKLDLTMNAVGEAFTMKLDADELFMQNRTDEPVRFKRGEPGQFDVEAMTTTPLAIFTFDERNQVSIRAVDDHPFKTLDMGEMLDSTLVLFPDLPAQPIPVGHRWSVTRNTPLGATQARVDVTYEFEYVGDGACPSGAPSCSLFAFTATSKNVDAMNEGVKMRVSFGFAGKVFFDLERNAVDESRSRADLDVNVQKQDMQIEANYILKSVR